jgi:hypothetical protein
MVSKLSSKVGHSGGIASMGRVQIGDMITAISVNNEEMLYLLVGPQTIQHKRASQAYTVLKQAQAHVRLQVERYKEKVHKNFSYQQGRTRKQKTDCLICIYSVYLLFRMT